MASQVLAILSPLAGGGFNAAGAVFLVVVVVFLVAIAAQAVEVLLVVVAFLGTPAAPLRAFGRSGTISLGFIWDAAAAASAHAQPVDGRLVAVAAVITATRHGLASVGLAARSRCDATFAIFSTHLRNF